jgi:hypothetical protein
VARDWKPSEEESVTVVSIRTVREEVLGWPLCGLQGRRRSCAQDIGDERTCGVCRGKTVMGHAEHHVLHLYAQMFGQCMNMAHSDHLHERT